jgi:ribonucleoside-triphosphate reductase
VTGTILLRRLIGKRPLLIMGSVLLPAILCSLLVWQYLSDWWQLSAYFWYSIPGNSFIWLPHEPAVIYAGAIYAPVLVAVVGGGATLIASMIDHALFTRAFRSKELAPLKESRLMRAVVDRFNRWPWWTIVVVAFTPLPFYPLRIVAPLANYPMFGYVSAVVVGRVPRYFLLALGGGWARQLTTGFAPW